MKSLFIILALLTSMAMAQEEEQLGWKVMPAITIVKHLPGGYRQSMNPQPIGDVYPGFVPIPMRQSDRYSGTGVSLNARFFNEDINPFVLTFSGGANWYSVARGSEPFGPPRVTPMENGDPMFARQGGQFDMGRNGRRFMSFPFGAGVQFVYPWKSVDKFMFFAGAEGNLVFTTIDLGMRDRVQAGYTLVGGVALKFVEIGVRYTAFRETKNLGVQIGFRLNSFEL